MGYRNLDKYDANSVELWGTPGYVREGLVRHNRIVRELAVEEERAKERPDLDGQEVMALLGIPGGPDVGQALRMLLEHRRTVGPLDHDEAVALLREWWAARVKAQ